MAPFKSSFDWHFNFSATEFRIIATLPYTGRKISPELVNTGVTTRIFDGAKKGLQAPAFP